jgi:hypothetical protein
LRAVELALAGGMPIHRGRIVSMNRFKNSR